MVIYKSGALYWLNEVTPSNYDVIRTCKGYLSSSELLRCYVFCYDWLFLQFLPLFLVVIFL